MYQPLNEFCAAEVVVVVVVVVAEVVVFAGSGGAGVQPPLLLQLLLLLLIVLHLFVDIELDADDGVADDADDDIDVFTTFDAFDSVSVDDGFVVLLLIVLLLYLPNDVEYICCVVSLVTFVDTGTVDWDFIICGGNEPMA